MPKVIKLFIIIPCLVNLILLSLFSYLQEQTNPNLQLTFLDVGQGDGTLISFPFGPQLIVDAGANKNFLRSLSRNINFFDRQIDYLLITHAHDDHFGGAVELIRRYKISQIIISAYDSKDLGYNYLLQEAQNKKIPIVKIGTETEYQINGVSILFIPPLSGEKNTNNQSLLTKIVYGQTSFFLVGDLEADGEKRLLSRNIDISSQILKSGHHGSKTSSSENFLLALKPQASIISVGENKFGHPSENTIKRFGDLGISVYRTDELGDIKLISNGQYIKKQREK